MTRLRTVLTRLFATSLACTFGRCERCIELVHRAPFGVVTFCHCTRPGCRHPYLLAVEEAAR